MNKQAQIREAFRADGKPSLFIPSMSGGLPATTESIVGYMETGQILMEENRGWGRCFMSTAKNILRALPSAMTPLLHFRPISVGDFSRRLRPDGLSRGRIFSSTRRL